MPELAYILKGDEARPITRLYHGIRYAVGIVVSAHRIARQLDQTTAVVSNAQTLNLSWEGASLKLRLPELSGCDISDEIRVSQSLGDGKFRFGSDAYQVTGVVGEHEWLVRRVRRDDTDAL